MSFKIMSFKMIVSQKESLVLVHQGVFVRESFTVLVHTVKFKCYQVYQVIKSKYYFKFYPS